MCRYEITDLETSCRNMEPNAKPGRKRRQKPGLERQQDSPGRKPMDDSARKKLAPTPDK